MIVVEIPGWLPPSLNAVATQGSRWAWTNAKKAAHARLRAPLEAAGLGPCVHVAVEGELTFPTRRTVDQGNYRSTLEKYVGDVLQEIGVLEDDDWAHYTFGDLAYRYEKGTSRTLLVLMPS